MHQSINRDSAARRGFVWHVGIAWIVVSLIQLGVNSSAIATMRFPDPDDTMRLIQVRDLLAGQSWFDLTQYRIDAPGGGVLMHWSRLVDLPLLAVISLLTPVLGAAAAELAALVLVPMLTMLCAMGLAARIAWRTIGAEETLLTCALLAIAVPALFQLSPMRIDHHGWQIVCALAAVNGLLASAARRGGWIIGASLATWLSISIEGLPLAAAIFAVLALRWLRDPEQRLWLVSAIQALAATSIALFLLTRGTGDLALHCDAVNPVHLAMFAWGAIVLSVLGQLQRAPLMAIVAGFAVAGGGALALLLGTAPQCVTGGGFAALDPLVAQFWYPQVREGLPLWHQQPDVALQFVVAPTLAILASIRLARRPGTPFAAFWRDYALILGAALLISLFVARAGCAACALAVAPLAWQVRTWLRAIRTFEQSWKRMLAMVGVVFALLPAFPLILLAAVLPESVSQTTGVQPLQVVKASRCGIPENAQILNALPAGEVFAPLDISPGLMVDSHHSVIATGHHRGNSAMKLVIETALGSSEAARQTLAGRDTAYVALCPNLPETNIYLKRARGGFIADLMAEETLAWLEPIPTAPGTTLRLFRIRPEFKPEFRPE